MHKRSKTGFRASYRHLAISHGNANLGLIKSISSRISIIRRSIQTTNFECAINRDPSFFSVSPLRSWDPRAIQDESPFTLEASSSSSMQEANLHSCLKISKSLKTTLKPPSMLINAHQCLISSSLMQWKRMRLDIF